MAILVPAHGVAFEVAPASGRAFSLAELQGFVGGYIEALRTADGRWMFIDEDGKRHRRPINAAATAMMQPWLRPDDVIVGDVIVCTPLEAGEGDEC